VLLPESAKEKPVVGEVLAVGPGKEKEDMKLAAGDKVVYFKYGGDKMMDGARYLWPPHATHASHPL
jgi:chaperonin GroES